MELTCRCNFNSELIAECTSKDCHARESGRTQRSRSMADIADQLDSTIELLEIGVGSSEDKASTSSSVVLRKLISTF